MRPAPRALLATTAGLVGVVALAAALSTPETPVTASVGTGGGRGVARAVVATLVLLALAAAPLLLLTLRRGTRVEAESNRTALVVLLLVAVVAVVGFLLWSAGGGAASVPTERGGLGPLDTEARSTPEQDGGAGGSGLAGLAVVGAVGLVGAGLLWLRLRNPGPSLDDAEERSGATRDHVAATAGAAADRLAEGDRPVDNVVYRAWREMTATLDVGDPDSTTPGEFAAAAVDAGLDADAVAELTAVFETVRYGDEDPQSYADRARRALERVERTVTTEEGEP